MITLHLYQPRLPRANVLPGRDGQLGMLELKMRRVSQQCPRGGQLGYQLRRLLRRPHLNLLRLERLLGKRKRAPGLLRRVERGKSRLFNNTSCFYAVVYIFYVTLLSTDVALKYWT